MKDLVRLASFAAFLLLPPGQFTWSAEPQSVETRNGDRLVAEYFRLETSRLAQACLSDIRTLEDWKSKRPEFHRQLREMLGLDPLPPKGDLLAKVEGTVEHPEFVVERLHFQSLPGLYVTGNLYRPRTQTERLPAVLYVCGHGGVKKNGISYGNKVHYQHHGAWFARNGYVCLTIDSLQLGEIEALHHGTHHLRDWWWLDRGYTPAGVEAWNCIRALDYLETRPEVDPTRFGVTGRSGGGAYSWWIAALDERIRAAVPVAGITDLEDHVVDGCVAGHCDCMYFVNTYRWDYPLLAALVAPRPLLISNTDSDAIFPLDGVVRVFEQTRRIYSLYGARSQVALNITAGGHQDTQELQVHAFRWLNHHLRKTDSLIEKTAVPFFEPEQLRVFLDLPRDQRNTQIQETFVGRSPAPPSIKEPAEWRRVAQEWRGNLETRVFRGWPEKPEPLGVETMRDCERDGLRLRTVDFTSQTPFRLRLYLVQSTQHPSPKAVHLTVVDHATWPVLRAALRPTFAPELEDESGDEGEPELTQALKARLESEPLVLAFVAPRGIGLTAWDPNEKTQTHIQRRYYLLGQTWESMQIWDVRRSLAALRDLPDLSKQAVRIQASGAMAGVVAYASLFESPLEQILLVKPTPSHRDGPHLLNVLRFFDLPQAIALASENAPLVIFDKPEPWSEAHDLLERIGRANRLHFAPAPTGRLARLAAE